MLRKLLLSVVLVQAAFAQDCTITAGTNISDSVICGECLNLTAFGQSQGNAFLSEDFNTGGFGPGWSSTPGATSFNNPCSPGGVDGTPHAWMDNNTTVPRTLTSASYDFSSSPAGVTVCFDLLFSEQGDAAPCEGPDEPDEGVFLQYSTDGGATWVDIHYFDPNGGGDPLLTNWNNWCFDLPPAALVNGVQIRWHQTADSGADYDHWGVDNVVIYQNDPNYEIVWSHDGYNYGVGNPGGENPNQVCITSETTYEVIMTNVNNPTQNCTTTVTVPVKLPNLEVTVSPTDTMVCPGECVDINATAKVIVSPAKVATYENNQLELVASGSASVNINITDLNQTTVNPGAIQEICINGFNYSGSETCTDFGGCDCNGTPINFLDNCDIDASSFNITVSSPDGCIITLVPANTLVTTGIQNMCFVPAGAPDVSTGSGNYSGTWDPSGSFDDVAGCQSNGVWTLEFNTGTGGLGIGFGSLTGWSITFDDPEISYPATYNWSPTTNLSDPNSLTPTACVSSNTTYTLEATDANNCITETAAINIQMDPTCCDFIFDPVQVQDPSCANNDGIININFINGTGPYNILAVTGDQSGALGGYPQNGVTNINLSALGAETWTITVEDVGGGCQKDTVITLMMANAPTLNVNNDDVCNDGTSTIDISTLATSSGNVSFYMSQNDADNGTNALINTFVGSGTYYVRAEDATDANCYTTDVIIIGLIDLPVVSIDPVAQLCDDDAAVNLVGTPSGGNFSGPGVNTGAFDPATAGIGTHSITYDYTDGTTGCSNSAQMDIEVVYCCDLQASLNTTTDETCANLGNITLTISGGDGNYQISANGSNFVPGNSIDIASGTYDITVQDGSGCEIMVNNITVNQIGGFNIDAVNITQPSCDNNDGSIEVVTDGAGLYPLSFTLNPGTTDNNVLTANHTFNNLSAGNYNITVVDDNGCTENTTAELILPAGPTFELNITPSDCGANNGVIDVINVVGANPVSYAIDGTSGGPLFSTLTPGNYTITVTDANNCSSDSLVTVTENNGGLMADFDITPNSGLEPLDVTYINNSTGNIVNNTWNINGVSFINNNNTFNEVYDAGTYTIVLTVDNGNGCSDTAMRTLIVESLYSLEIPNIFTPNDDGSNDLFYVQSEGISQLNCYIYNRWGNIIVSFDALEKGWNGKNAAGTELEDGVYFFLLEGTKNNGESIEENGNITLVR